jgi:hypothetical protein
MKITKQKLIKIIKEELKGSIEEGRWWPDPIDISEASEELKQYLTTYWGNVTLYGTVAPAEFGTDDELDYKLFKSMKAAGISADVMNSMFATGASIYKSTILDAMTDPNTDADEDSDVVWGDPEARLGIRSYLSALHALRRVKAMA